MIRIKVRLTEFCCIWYVCRWCLESNKSKEITMSKNPKIMIHKSYTTYEGIVHENCHSLFSLLVVFILVVMVVGHFILYYIVISLVPPCIGHPPLGHVDDDHLFFDYLVLHLVFPKRFLSRKAKWWNTHFTIIYVVYWYFHPFY